MPEQLEKALREATADLRVAWAPPEELRRRATRRRRRLIASAALVSAIALVGAGRFAVVQVIGLPEPAHPCSTVDPMTPTEADVRVNVYNASARADLAQEVATHLRNRRFNVMRVAPADVLLADDAVAVVRYGSNAITEAFIVRAHLGKEATEEFDAARQDNIVDLLLGPRFVRLAEPGEVRWSIEYERSC